MSDNLKKIAELERKIRDSKLSDADKQALVKKAEEILKSEAK